MYFLPLFCFLLVYIPLCQGSCPAAHPKLTAISEELRRHEKYENYYITLPGLPLEIYCSGNAESLIMLNGEEIYQSVMLNETTLKLSIKPRAKSLYTLSFECVDTQAKCNNSSIIFITVVNPKAKNFTCLSRPLRLLNCRWNIENVLPYPWQPEDVGYVYTKFRLYFVEDTGTTLIYKYSTILGEYTHKVSSLWYNTGIPPLPSESVNLTFIVETCFHPFCFNETFSIIHLSITRPDPPYDLTVKQKTSRSALLTWDTYIPFKAEMQHKIEFSFYGVEPLSVNMSIIELDEDGLYTVNLTLPCPDKAYEVRIYAKPSTAIGEEFWSDYASTSFYTEADTDVVPPECNLKPTLAPKDMMIYKIYTMRESIHKELKKIRDDLKSKEEAVAVARASKEEL